MNFSAPGPKQGSTSCNEAGNCDDVFSYPMFRDLERGDGPFVGVAAHRLDRREPRASRAQTASGSGLLVSGRYFSLLGVEAGPRPFARTRRRSRRRRGERVVLSYDYWAAAFGARSGRRRPQARRQRQAARRSSASRRAASGARRRRAARRLRADHVPLAREPERVPESRRSQELLGLLFARLKPGVSLEQAAAAINGAYPRDLNDVEAPLLTGSQRAKARAVSREDVVLAGRPRPEQRSTTDARAPLTILLVATGLVLLIACVNIANLMLARGSARARRDGDARVARGLAAPVARAVARSRRCCSRRSPCSRACRSDAGRRCTASATMLPASNATALDALELRHRGDAGFGDPASARWSSA